jgi:uncharacterized protein
MIHQYKLNGYNIVLDINSGSIHVPDPLAYEAIRLIDESGGRGSSEEIGRRLLQEFAPEGVTQQEVDETLEDIAVLRREGKLFSEETFADRAFDLKKRNTVIKALCLLVAHTCNLNCSYCFAAQGNFRGQHGLMSFETENGRSISWWKIRGCAGIWRLIFSAVSP